MFNLSRIFKRSDEQIYTSWMEKVLQPDWDIPFAVQSQIRKRSYPLVKIPRLRRDSIGEILAQIGETKVEFIPDDLCPNIDQLVAESAHYFGFRTLQSPLKMTLRELELYFPDRKTLRQTYDIFFNKSPIVHSTNTNIEFLILYEIFARQNKTPSGIIVDADIPIVKGPLMMDKDKWIFCDWVFQWIQNIRNSRFNRTSIFDNHLRRMRKADFLIPIITELQQWKRICCTETGFEDALSPAKVTKLDKEMFGYWFLALDQSGIPVATMLSHNSVVAQIGVEVKHTVEIPFFEAFFKNKAIDEVFEAANLCNGIIDSQFMESVKVRCVSLCTTIYNLCRWSQGFIKTPDLIVNLTSALLTSVPTSVLYSAFKSIFSVNVAQDNAATIHLLLKCLITVLFMLVAKSLPGKHTIDEFINRVHTIPRAMSGLDQFWSKIDGIVGKATDFVDEHIYGNDVSAKQAQYIDSVQAWADKVAVYSGLFKRRLINRDEQTLREAAQLHTQGVRLLAQCMRLSYDRKNAELIRSLLATTYKISEAALKSGADKSRVRMEPIIVWFNGFSGVGKSVLSYPFILDVMKSDGEDMSRWEQNIYARVPETEYWDGYVDQEYIIYDDAFQLKDSIAKPSVELFEMIRLGNLFPYQLHMASIEEKNNTFAQPKMVFLTSNLDHIQAQSIHYPEAVERRINFAYHVYVKEQYRLNYEVNGRQLYKLDTTKVRTDAQNPVDFSVYEFQRYDPHTMEVSGKTISYAEVVEQVAAALSSKRMNYSTMSDFLNTYKDEDIASRCYFSPRISAQVAPEYIPTSEECSAGYNFQHPDPYRGFQASRNGYLHQGQGFLYPGYQMAKTLTPAWFYCKLRNMTYMYGHASSLVVNKALEAAGDYMFPGCNFAERCRERYNQSVKYFRPYINVFSQDHEIRENARWMLYNGDYAYMDKDWRFMDDKVIAQIDEDYIHSRIKSWKKWCTDVFRSAYRKVRYNLPGICVRIIGIACALRVFKRIYDTYGAKHVATLNEKIAEIQQQLNKAETCYRSGKCESCNICGNVTEADLNDFAYWGVPCKCFVNVCKKQKSAHKRLFMAYINSKLSIKTTNVTAQARLQEFASTCDCEDCPLCEDECECRRIALERGVPIGEDDLLDRNGMYGRLQHEINAQNTDQQGWRVKQQRNVVRVQNFDHQGKQQRQSKNIVRVQNHDQQGWRVPRSKQQVIVQSKEVEPQGGVISAQARSFEVYDVNGEAIMENRLWPNLMRLYIVRKEDQVIVRHFGHVLGLKGSCFLMNWHFVLAMRSQRYADCDVVIRSMQSTILYKSSIPDFLQCVVQVAEKDACIVALNSRAVASLPNILKHFQTKDVSYSRASQSITIVRYKINDQTMMCSPIVLSQAELIMEPIEITMNTSEGSVIFANAMSWMYQAATRDGDCGAPLMLNNSRIPVKIVGIHNAACPSTGDAYGVPLYREDLEKALQQIPVSFQYGWEDANELVSTSVVDFNDGDNFLVVGCEDTPVPACSVTSLRRSPVFGQLIPTLTKPGHLRPFTNAEGVIVDPPVLSRRKWGYHQPLINKRIASIATNFTTQILNRKTKVDVREYHIPLTLEEAVIGIPGVEHLNSINKTSSPGYPYVLNKRSGSGKTGYFGKYEFDLQSEGAREVLAAVCDMERKMVNGIRPKVVWIDTMKDARIPIAKADAGKTRIFSAGPQDYVILYRKYFLPYFGHLMSNRINNMMAPGINAVSPEWHKLALRMKSKGSKCIAGDYSNYDGKACIEGYRATVKACIIWYRQHWQEIIENQRNVIAGKELTFEEFSEFLERVFFEVINHIHGCNKMIDGKLRFLLYQVVNGMPSGNPGTAIANSVCGIWMFVYCWLTITDCDELRQYNNVQSFYDNVYMCTYGDDVIANISDNVISFFNQVRLTSEMKANFDIDFTDESKTGEIVEYRTLAEIRFLKRAFVYNPYLQLYISPLPIDVILDISNWIKIGGEKPYIVCVNNLKTIHSELALVGEGVFNKYNDKIQQLGAKLVEGTNIAFILEDYWTYLDKYKCSDVEFSVNTCSF